MSTLEGNNDTAPEPPAPIDWNALAAQVQANFAATGQWFVDGETPPPPAVVDWNALAAEVTANFAATGQWFVSPPTPPPPTGPAYVFSADDGVHGRELWTTDGTEAGTHLLKDINAAGDSFPFSFPGAFEALGDGQVLFGATDGTTGVELWVTDGTEAGTQLLKEFVPGSNGGDPRSFMALGDGRTLFAADDPVAGRSLWVSDGTADGTRLVSSATNGTSPLETDYSLLYPGVALVAGAGNQLLLTDGTAAGTQLVKDFGAADVPPFGFTQLTDGHVLFRAEDATGAPTGAELWISDGTAAGTHLLKDINPGSGDSFPSYIHPLSNGTALFTAFDPVHGSEFWITDGTEAGTHVLQDIRPGLAGGAVSGSDNILDLGGGRAVFVANDGSTAPNSGRPTGRMPAPTWSRTSMLACPTPSSACTPSAAGRRS